MEIPRNAAIALRSTIRVLMPDGTVVPMPLERYLRGVVPHEMPASAPLEALKAQAVAARCYAVNQTKHRAQDADVCTTTHCQVWEPTDHPGSDAAIEATAGVVAIFGGRIINALFFARCNGTTRPANEAWPSVPPIPYLSAVACPRPFSERHGHGVGLCQEGSIALAESGADYVTILKHFYQGVEVVSTALPAPLPTPPPTPPPPPPPVEEELYVLLAGPLSPESASGLHRRLPPAIGATIQVIERPAGWELVGVERFASRRALAGDLGEFGIDVTVRDEAGNFVTVQSGLAPAYGPGGWEVLTWREGAFHVQVEGEAFPVQADGGLTVLTLQRAPDVSGTFLQSAPMDLPAAQRWLGEVAMVVPGLFRLLPAPE